MKHRAQLLGCRCPLGSIDASSNCTPGAPRARTEGSQFGDVGTSADWVSRPFEPLPIITTVLGYANYRHPLLRYFLIFGRFGFRVLLQGAIRRPGSTQDPRGGVIE